MTFPDILTDTPMGDSPSVPEAPSDSPGQENRDLTIIYDYPPGTAWIGVNLDGTLAKYEHGDHRKYGWDYVGEPISLMVERVKTWISQGTAVKIITARVSCEDQMELAEVTQSINHWQMANLGFILPITCRKDYSMIELWDDRAIQTISNTGIRADGAK